MSAQQIKLSDWALKWQMKFIVSKCGNGKHLLMGKKQYLWFISVFVLTKNLLLLGVLPGSVQRALEASRKVVSAEVAPGTSHSNWAPRLGRDCLEQTLAKAGIGFGASEAYADSCPMPRGHLLLSACKGG